MGAGVQVVEAYQAVDAQGYRVGGGICPTVGLAGGYTQGAGHGDLSSTYGLAADQTLEWEVVTAEGQHLVASPTRNSDLYWALSRGGGTYAVVMSLTSRLYPDGMVGGANLTVSSTGLSQDQFWDIVELWHDALPAVVDAGARVTNTMTKDLLFVGPISAPAKSEAEVRQLLALHDPIGEAQRLLLD